MSSPHHVYPALSLRSAWAILGNKTPAELVSNKSLLLSELEAATVSKSVPAWTRDAPFVWDSTAIADGLSHVAQSSVSRAKSTAPSTAEKKSRKGVKKAKHRKALPLGAWGAEEWCSGALYSRLRNVPPAVQEDPEFWLYISCVLMYDLLAHHDPVGSGKKRAGKLAGKHLGTPSVDGTNNADSFNRTSDILAKRMFLRGRLSALGEVNQTRGLSIINNLSEAESSHLHSGRTGRQPLYASALTEKVRNTPGLQNQNSLRRKVRGTLNPRKATKVIEALTRDEIEKLIN